MLYGQPWLVYFLPSDAVQCRTFGDGVASSRAATWTSGTSKFEVRISPSGRSFSPTSWGDLWASLPELDVPWRNVSFESNHVRDQVLKAWGKHPDAPAT